jgi:PAS domain S-box-containing protein
MGLCHDETLLRDVEKVASLGTWEWNPETGTVSWSDQLYRIYGVSPDEYGPSLEEYLKRVHPEDRERVRDAIFRAARDKVSFSQDERIVLRDGNIRYLHTWGYCLLGEKGNLTHLIGVCQDITDRVRAESRLRALADTSRLVAEGRLDLQTILDNATRMVAEFCQDGCIIRLVGAELPGLETVSYHHVDPRAQRHLRELIPQIRDYLDQGAAKQVLRERGPVLISGTVEEMRARLHPRVRGLLDEFPLHAWIVAPLRVAGKVIGFMTVFRSRQGEYSPADISFLQDLADRTALAISNAIFHHDTRNALRLRDDFILLAAHELRTPLTSLKLQVQTLEKRVQDPALARMVKGAAESTARMASLVERMLEMAGLASGSLQLMPEPTDLSVIVKDTLARYRERIQASGSILSLTLEAAVIGSWDRSRIDEILEALLKWALAISHGKRIQVLLARERECARLELRIGDSLTQGGRLQQMVGFDREITIEQLGLGVYIAQELIEAHGGRCRLQGEMGKQFAFIVELPLEFKGSRRRDPEALGA